MPLRLVQVNCKAADDAALGRFWAGALGWTVSATGGGATSATPAGFDWTADDAPVCVDVIAVPDVAAGQGRVHVDLAHRPGLVERLCALGATRADIGQGDVPWTVLAGPGGHLLCVLEPRDVYRDTGPIAAIVVECADLGLMAGFWSSALGWTLHGRTDETASLRHPAGTGPYLEFIRKTSLRPAHNRVHLDLVPYAGDDRAAEVARLLAMGAAHADVGQGDVPWTVLTDPEGNEFCVLARS